MLNVLLVEDDEKIRDILSRFLKGSGHHVISATNGEEAVGIVDGNKFDIILMDIRMPKLDGLSALQMIRKNNSTPVVLITGYQVTEAVERVLKDPTVACLKKPFTFDELRSVIAKMALNGKGVPNA